MLWIYQEQSNDVRWLQQRGVHIWDKWMVDDDGIYRTYINDKKEHLDVDKSVLVYDVNNALLYDNSGEVMMASSLYNDMEIKEAKYFGLEYAHIIGTAYGYIVKK